MPEPELSNRQQKLEELWMGQQHALDALSEVVTQLGSRVDSLTRRLTRLERVLATLAEHAALDDDLPHEKPPHY